MLKVSLGSKMPLTSLVSMRIDIAQYLPGSAQYLAVLCLKGLSWVCTECKRSKDHYVMKCLLQIYLLKVRQKQMQAVTIRERKSDTLS